MKTLIETPWYTHQEDTDYKFQVGDFIKVQTLDRERTIKFMEVVIANVSLEPGKLTQHVVVQDPDE